MKKKNTKKSHYVKSITGTMMPDYHLYSMSKFEKIAYFLLAFIVGAAVGFLFYGGLGKNEFNDPTIITYILNMVIILVCGIGTGKFFLPIRNQQIIRSRQLKLRGQFRDMLEALATALGSGKNVTDSFQNAYIDMQNQYEEDAFILSELANINRATASGINIEEVLTDFGKRSALQDIEVFANVFEVCYRKGGNVRETIMNTCHIISEKVEVSQEIETTVAASKNEQYIMLVMPVIMVAMIKSASADFAKNFATVSGVISTTIALALFVASYFLGKKLLDIKV